MLTILRQESHKIEKMLAFLINLASAGPVTAGVGMAYCAVLCAPTALGIFAYPLCIAACMAGAISLAVLPTP